MLPLPRQHRNLWCRRLTISDWSWILSAFDCSGVWPETIVTTFDCLQLINLWNEEEKSVRTSRLWYWIVQFPGFHLPHASAAIISMIIVVAVYSLSLLSLSPSTVTSQCAHCTTSECTCLWSITEAIVFPCVSCRLPVGHIAVTLLLNADDGKGKCYSIIFIDKIAAEIIPYFMIIVIAIIICCVSLYYYYVHRPYYYDRLPTTTTTAHATSDGPVISRVVHNHFVCAHRPSHRVHSDFK